MLRRGPIVICENTVVVEPILFDDLSEDEKAAVLRGFEEDERDETVCMEEINWD